MPKPNPDEAHDDFIHRCMGDPEANDSFPDSDQRMAFCQSQWDRRNENSRPGKMEYKGIRLTETKANDTTGAFSGYGAIFGNIDATGDVIEHGAFKRTLKEWKKERGKWPPMLLQHGGGFFGGNAEDLLPVGQWHDMEENRKGLKVDGQLFALNTEKGQYIYEGLKTGVLDGLSIGYETKQFIQGTKPGEPNRKLVDLELWEVSIVTFPANDAARITAVKNLSIKEVRELEGILRDGGLSHKEAAMAIPAFKRWLQRDAEVPGNESRDEMTPDEKELLNSAERVAGKFIREIFSR